MSEITTWKKTLDLVDEMCSFVIAPPDVLGRYAEGYTSKRIALTHHLRMLHAKLGDMTKDVADKHVNSYYAVMSEHMNEGVLFKHKEDALFASTAKTRAWQGVPNLACYFRNIHCKGQYDKLPLLMTTLYFYPEDSNQPET